MLNKMFIFYLFYILFPEYDFFDIMLNNNQKTAQIRKKKTKPNFDFIVKEILNLDIEKKLAKQN